MCDTCQTLICALFDHLLRDYFQDFPVAAARPAERYRPRIIPLDLRDKAESEATKYRFKEMVEAATGIGYSPGEFLNKLATKSGFEEHVRGWARGKLPNGLARKVILTCAEEIIRERGAAPTLTLLQAA